MIDIYILSCVCQYLNDNDIQSNIAFQKIYSKYNRTVFRIQIIGDGLYMSVIHSNVEYSDTINGVFWLADHDLLDNLCKLIKSY